MPGSSSSRRRGMPASTANVRPQPAQLSLASPSRSSPPQTAQRSTSSNANSVALPTARSVEPSGKGLAKDDRLPVVAHAFLPEGHREVAADEGVEYRDDRPSSAPPLLGGVDEARRYTLTFEPIGGADVGDEE